MAELLYGQETIPADVSHPIPLTVEQVNISTQEGFGPGPAESQIIHDEAERQRAIDAERERLAAMQLSAKFAHEMYYGIGGEGYGTTPGGPDVTYMPSDAPFVAKVAYQALDPLYGEGGVFEPVTRFVSGETDKSNLLLYAALGIGALALLKR